MLDTTKANILNQICEEYLGSNSNKGMEYAQQSLSLFKQIGFKKGIAYTYLNIGNIYFLQSNYPEALKNYLTALKINEEIGDKAGIASSHNNIGNIYDSQNNYPEALKNYLATLKITKEIQYTLGITSAYGNIGKVCQEQGNYPEAHKNYLASLALSKELGNTDGIASALINIGFLYQEQGNYSEALKNLFSTLEIYDNIGNKEGIALCNLNIGNVYFKQKKNKYASLYMNKGLSAAMAIGNLENIKYGYYSLSILDSSQGNFRQAIEHYKMFISTRDSIYNQENTKKLVQSQMQYDFDKKEAESKAVQEKKNAVTQAELQKQKLVRNGFIGGFAVVLLFAGVFFTQRNKIKQGKKVSDELLLNILPEEVAEELKAKGSADAKQFDQVTVMFTDFSNFTQISEQLSPKELVAEIHSCFKAFDDIIGRHNIEKIKTIGDSYMCAGGLPVTNQTNAIDVVSAAIEIQEFMNTPLDSDVMSDGQVSPSGRFRGAVRIGIHTGPVVAGIVGVKKFAYDIWGDTVNIASRMESSGEAGKVNISGSTYELVKDLPAGQASKFMCDYRGEIEAKGKGKIRMYFVTKSPSPADASEYL